MCKIWEGNAHGHHYMSFNVLCKYMYNGYICIANYFVTPADEAHAIWRGNKINEGVKINQKRNQSRNIYIYMYVIYMLQLKCTGNI